MNEAGNGGIGSAKRDAFECVQLGNLNLSGEKNISCLLVLGMHRSGTSALARILNLAGAALPRNLLGAREGNEIGHWEPEKLMSYNQRLLVELGTDWNDWRPIELDRLSDGELSAARSDIEDILREEFNSHPLWVLKEPRICRLSKFYLEILKDMGTQVLPVLIHRNPLEVISSLLARSDWPAHLSSVDASLLWLRHVLDAEYATRNLDRAVLSYSELMSDPITALKRVAKETGAGFSNDLDEITPEVFVFLNPDQRHHIRSSEEVALHPVLGGWMEDTYNAMCNLERSRHSKAAIKTLDDVRAAFGALTPIIGAFSEEARDAKQSRHVEVEELNNHLQDRQTELSEASATLQLTGKELEQARRDIEAGQKTIDEKSQQIEAISEQLGEQQAILSAVRNRIGAREGDDKEIAELVDAHLEHLAAAHQEQLDEQARQYADQQNRLVSEIANIEAARNAISTELAGAQQGRDRISAELAQVQAEREAVSDELDGVKRNSSELLDQLSSMSEELVQATNQIDQIHLEYRQSTSWKITRPLRLLRDASTRIVSRLQAYFAGKKH